MTPPLACPACTYGLAGHLRGRRRLDRPLRCPECGSETTLDGIARLRVAHRRRTIDAERIAARAMMLAGAVYLLAATWRIAF